MKKHQKNILLIFFFSLLITGSVFLLLVTTVRNVKAITMPKITVDGYIYAPDGVTSFTIGDPNVKLVFSPDNKLFSSAIQIGDGYENSEGLYKLETCTKQIPCSSNYQENNHVYVSFGDKNFIFVYQNRLVKFERPKRIDLGVITESKVFHLDPVRLTEANVFGKILEPSGNAFGSMPARVVMTKVGEAATWDDQMMANISGSNGEFWFYREPGDYTLQIYGGQSYDQLLRTLTVQVGSSGLDMGYVYTDDKHTDLENFSTVLSTPKSPSVSELLAGVDRTRASKDTVGLNVNLTLQLSDITSGAYIRKLVDSGTKWAREHFSTKDDLNNSKNWENAYEQARNYYRRNGINIVGMLAYGFLPDEFSQPDLKRWSDYVSQVVQKNKDYIKVWEIWNEPDSSSYLKPNTIENYIPILKAGYEAVKSVDPDALVLNGPISWPNANYIEKLYQQGSAYFDELAFHVYYCDQYKKNGNNRQLQVDFAKVLAVVNKYRPSDKIWITELGCSTYDGYSEAFQKEYLEKTVPYLLSSNKVEKIFLYTTRDRSIGDPYENNFGLLRTDFSPKPAWNWYVSLPGSQVTQGGISVASGKSFFAYGSRIRGGYQISSGNVLGDSKAEIITGTGDGMAPQVKVFDSQGNLQSQFFAFDSSSRNGVTVSACDVNNDGYDEIVAAQGRGSQPIVKIFDGHGNIINNGFFVLDGKFKGGVNLSCGDINGDGHSEIVVAARQGGGPNVQVYDYQGHKLVNFMAYDKNFRGGVNVTAIDMDNDGKDEIVTGPQVGAPHIQIFKVSANNEVKRLSPGFYAFSPGYRGGVSVAGADINGDGKKELLVGVGDNAKPLVKVYNVKNVLQKQFYAYATNFLGGVNVAGGDVDGDGTDEILTIPRSLGGPNVKVIEANKL